MLIVISPAKRLDWDVPKGRMLVPRLQDQADALAGHARQLSLRDLRTLMGLSEDLARLNRDRFRAMKDPEADPRPAARAFAGDTYQGLDYASLDETGADFADDHLRILSGLYGLLRPRDAILPYRLEMGSRLKTRRGKTLYDFWGDRIAEQLSRDAADAGTGVLVNCASQEYFGAVDGRVPGLRVVTPRFLDEKDGEARVISFYAKRARGAMARFICENRLTDPEALCGFTSGGYVHAPDRSDPDAPTFLRSEEAAAAA